MREDLIQKQSGQVIIILLLLMLVALSIGLSVTQRSVTDVTTSTQTEQSSRALSAAEAGIEKALTGNVSSGTSIPLNNDSTAVIESSLVLPVAGTREAIEYPPNWFSKENTAQFWFTDPNNPAVSYNYNNFTAYFGNEWTADKPAIEIKVIIRSNENFYTVNYHYDSDTLRAPAQNNFTFVPGCGSIPLASSILGTNRTFFCRVTVGPTAASPTGIPDLGTASPNDTCPNANCKLILARVRLLYANQNHKLALAPLSTGEFPPQIRVYNATGISGQSEKQLQAFRIEDVIPPWFDFALFSVNEISK